MQMDTDGSQRGSADWSGILLFWISQNDSQREFSEVQEKVQNEMKWNMEKLEFHLITSGIPTIVCVCVCGDYWECCSIYDTNSY